MADQQPDIRTAIAKGLWNAAEVIAHFDDLRAQVSRLQAGGGAVAWRWRNSLGEIVTNWLEYKADQHHNIERQVSDEGGCIEYAYAHPPAAPALVPLTDEQIGEVYALVERDRKDQRAWPFIRAAIAEFCRINGLTVGGGRVEP